MDGDVCGGTRGSGISASAVLIHSLNQHLLTTYYVLRRVLWVQLGASQAQSFSPQGFYSRVGDCKQLNE